MSELTIVRAAIPLDPEILPLLRQGVASPQRRAQYDFLQQWLSSFDTRQLVCHVARREEEMVGAVLAQLQPGRLAMVWGPASRPSEPVVTDQKLVERLRDDLRLHQIRLMQVSLPADDAESYRAMLQVGFQWLADILYMVRQLSERSLSQPFSSPASASAPQHGPGGTSRPQELPFELVPLDRCDWGELTEVVTATYLESLDCPSLQELRPVEEVLEGYRGSARWDPSMWYVLRSSGRGVGCCLLSGDHASSQWEVIYWGLVPDVRGRGWGERLMRWVLERARGGGARQILLAVDEANGPARAIYRRLGFVTTVARRVLVAPVDPRCGGTGASLPVRPESRSS